MATTEQHDPMEGVERRRAQLEENVSKLQQALRHWQTLEMEYEMLKEEIQFADSPSRSKMIEIGANLGATLLDSKEVQELVGDDKTERSANQVVDMISRRIDYVQQNISGAAKRLDDAEKKLAGTSVLLEPEMENEEGLPLMDIQEELDEEGNVISSSLLQPAKAAPEIVEALRKAGVHKLEQDKAKSSKGAKEEPSSGSTPAAPTKENTPSGKIPTSAPDQKDSETSLPVRPKKSVAFSEDTKTEAPKKSVAFAEDTKPGAASRTATLDTTGYNEEFADYNFTKGTKVIEVDEDDNEIASYPIIPQGESPEDAELRRQMLQYGLSEVGAVVAEIDIEGRDYDSDEDMEDYDYDDEYDSEEEEIEDKYGRSLKREVSEDYRKQMLELEQKLNARMLENVGPRPDNDEFPLAEFSNDLRTLKIKKDDSLEEPANKPTDVSTESSSQKKGVRFADDLDISPVPQPTKAPVEPVKPAATSTSTISDTIVERSGPAPQAISVEPPKPAKVSRFKSSRGSSAPGKAAMLPTPAAPELPPVPTGPQGRTIANTIVEHDVTMEDPHIPDEFDPVTINREVQVQYHKMRNKMIQQQGGFKPTEEEKDQPIVEVIDGKEKKVSRFRAARLKEDGL